jgi:hypothetical protein
MRLGDVAAGVGEGLFAGVVGTAAITVSSTPEMRIRGCPGSSAPAEAAGKVLGVKPKGEAEETRFSNTVRWGYRMAWGTTRGIIGVAGFEGRNAAAAHFGVVWGAEQVVLPALASPFWLRGRKRQPSTPFTTSFTRPRLALPTPSWTANLP